MAKKGFQTNIQDLIYSVDTGMGLKLIRTILYLLLILVVCLVYTATQFHGFKDPAPMDYAQLARNMSVHKKFVTQNVRPQAVAFLTRNETGAAPAVGLYPEMNRAPLYPASMALSMMMADVFDIDLFAPTAEGERPSRVFEAERWFAIPANHVYVFLTGLFLFLLARRLFNEQTSFWAVTFYFVSDMVWADSIASVGLPMISFCVVAALYFAVRAEHSWRNNEPAVRWSFLLILSAVLSACAFLTRYAAGIIGLVVFLFYVINCWRRRSGWWPPLFFLMIFFAAIMPWIARNWMVSHSPFGLAPFCMLEGEGGTGSAEALARNLDGTFSLSQLIRVAKPRWVSTISEVYKSGLFPGGGILAAFYLLSFSRKYKRADVRSLRAVAFLGLILAVVIGGFFGAETVRLCHAFWPLVLLFGIAFFFTVIDEMELPFVLLNQAVLVLVFIVAGVGPFLLTLMPPRPKMPQPTYYYPVTQYVCELLKPNEIICTDQPWATAWYGNRTSILLPKTVDQFYEINDYRKNIKALYFTALTKDKKFTTELLGSDSAWFNLSMGNRPPEFPLTEGMAPMTGQYFLSDYVRWSTVAQRKEAQAKAAEAEAKAAAAE